ncbi:immunoglobulin E-set [Scheffersomyces amazonensis]|uniref:immunoglobulin E-set n=1 Tax=Scheffersomyces amazonensis TaxID=1078765 RepID=UPI00315D5771
MTKTFNEIPVEYGSIDEKRAEFSCDLFDIEEMHMVVDGFEDPLVFRRNDEILPKQVHYIVPEGSKYKLIIKYKVKNKSLQNLQFEQIIKKHGITIRKRIVPMQESAEVNINKDYLHVAFIPQDTVPSGILVRGQYLGHSYIYEDGKIVWDQPFIIEIVKKGNAPCLGSYD